MMKIRKIEILGVPFDAITYEEVLKQVETLVKKGSQVYFTTPNPEMLVHAEKDPEFLQVLKASALTLPDGTGILWASRYLSLSAPKNCILRFFHLVWSLLILTLRPSLYRKILPERVTGTDLLVRIVQRSGEKGWRIFLLGAKPGVAESAAQKFTNRYPNALLVGTHAGNPTWEEEKTICEKINQTAPDILFVAYGSPKQEFWIHRNLSRLNTVKIAIGVGGALDFVSGKIKRAPYLMRQRGLEWMWRMIREPRRFKRIWRATVVFIRLVNRSHSGIIKTHGPPV